MLQKFIWLYNIPYSSLHSSNLGKIREAVLWLVSKGGSKEGEFGVESWDLIMSIRFPSNIVGGGPLMPCFLSLERTTFGFFTKLLYKRNNSVTKPMNKMDVKNCKSYWSFIAKNSLSMQTQVKGDLICYNYMKFIFWRKIIWSLWICPAKITTKRHRF